MPTTLVRRLISAFSRSSGLVRRERESVVVVLPTGFHGEVINSTEGADDESHRTGCLAHVWRDRLF